MARSCAAHKHRTEEPLDAHHVYPLYAGGPDTVDNLVDLCPNAHRAVHEYLRELLKEERTGLFTLDRRCYGPRVREIALEGYRRIRESRG
jgi:hypothetical protein